MTTTKDPIAVFMRLLFKALLDTSEPATNEARKRTFVLRSNIDKSVEEYFKNNPEQAPGLGKYSPNRLGSFMRYVKNWRLSERFYYKCKTRDKLMTMMAIRKYLDEGIDEYFKQNPLEKPIELLNQQLPSLFV